jgi:hypothetical protein
MFLTSQNSSAIQLIQALSQDLRDFFPRALLRLKNQQNFQ